MHFTNCSLCFLVSHAPSPPRSSQKSGKRKPRILGCTEGHLGTSHWVIVYGMRKIGPVFWTQHTKQSVSLCQRPLTSGALMFTGSVSFPQHNKHQTNNKLLFCVCSFPPRLVAKPFISCPWDAGTFTIDSDCICKANSIFFYHSHLTMSPADPVTREWRRLSIPILRCQPGSQVPYPSGWDICSEPCQRLSPAAVSSSLFVSDYEAVRLREQPEQNRGRGGTHQSSA